MTSHSEGQHSHDYDAGHVHGAGHLHVHAPRTFGFAFAAGTSLNVLFVIVETIFGFLGNSYCATCRCRA